MKRTFLGFQEELELSQAFQDLHNMVAVSGQAPGVNENVIYVDEHKIRRCLAVRHDEVLIVASRGHKHCFPFIPLTYPDEVICAAEVQHGEDRHGGDNVKLLGQGEVDSKTLM